MLNMIKGCNVPDSNQLSEGYMVYAKGIEANVNADKILSLFLDFIDAHLDFFFLIIEVPTNEKDEPKDENGNIPAYHKDVYYIDGMNAAEIRELLNKIGDIFINDGLAQIGVGAHNSRSEIMTDKYNRVYALGQNIPLFEAIFSKNAIPKAPNLMTAWDLFSKDKPGESYIIQENEKTVFDVLEELKKDTNIYFAERREE